MCNIINCAWNCTGNCVSEFPDVYDDETFETEECIGFVCNEDY